MLASTAHAGDAGLLAHWSFDEGKGTVARDLTGNGFDAQIAGPLYVRSPRGYALRFDGKDDTVTYARHPQMLIEGDLTLLVWAKTDSSVASKTNRLVFGDSGAGVYRNLNLRLGPYGHLRFEWGNDTSNANLLADAKLLDGTWKHIAVVCDCTAMLARMYVDGHCVAQMRMPLPISKTHYGTRRSGRFFDGCLKGEIDEVKVYRRALSEREVLEAYRSQAVLELGKAEVLLVPDGVGVEAQMLARVTNWTRTSRTVHLAVQGEAERTVEIGPKRSIPVPFGEIPIERLFGSRTDLYAVANDGQAHCVKISTDLDGARDEQTATLSVNPLIEAIRVEVDDPWSRDLSAEKTQRIRMTVCLGFAKHALSAGELVVTLTPRHREGTLLKKRYARPPATKVVEFATRDLDWGAYDVSAAFDGATARTVATVLPGGDERIVVLNNLVSELMNAQQRGLLERRELTFMNPRKGWCFFKVGGDATAKLSSEDAPLPTPEAMRLLPAGRHVLYVTGEPTQVVVRAIPALVHNVYPTSPGIRAFGPHTWERMAKFTLPNCNMIESHKIDIPECDEWLAQGRHWIMNRLAAWLTARRYGGTFDSPEAIYQYWRKMPGFGTDKISGVQVDEYGGGG